MYKINGSVGRGGRNARGDVLLVQTLLNRHILPPYQLLAVDGVAGHKTISAIVFFQHRLGMKPPDGRVDPADLTLRALLSTPQSSGVGHFLPLGHAFTTSAKVTHNIMSLFKTTEPRGNRAPHSNSNWKRPNRSTTTAPPLGSTVIDAIAWGARVSAEFKKRVIEICKELEISPDYLMTCMALETCETFRANIENKTSHAIGLIQFTSVLFKDLQTSKDSLASMTNVKQLDYVRIYFLPYKGKIKILEDVYMAILCPAAVGKGLRGVVYKQGGKHPKYYEQNRKLDQNNDAIITVQECSNVLRAKYRKGLSKGFLG